MMKLYWRIRNFILYRVFRFKRTLSAKWTIDPDVEFVAMHSEGAEDQLVESLTAELLTMSDDVLADTIQSMQNQLNEAQLDEEAHEKLVIALSDVINAAMEEAVMADLEDQVNNPRNDY